GGTGLDFTVLSVSGWFKTSGTTASDYQRGIICRYKFVSGDARGYYIHLSDGHLFFTVNGNGYGTTQDYEDGNWHHFVITYDSSTKHANVYVDNVHVITDKDYLYSLTTGASINIYVGDAD